MKKMRLIAIAAAVLLVLAACSAQSRIVGTWEGQSSLLGIVTEYEYTFNEDGTGKVPGPLGLSVDMKYTVEGDTLVIKNAVVEAAEEIVGKDFSTTYTVKFGSGTLTLVDAEGKEINLTKVK